MSSADLSYGGSGSNVSGSASLGSSASPDSDSRSLSGQSSEDAPAAMASSKSKSKGKKDSSSSDDGKTKKTSAGMVSPVTHNRGCTDILFLILFILFWCGFVVVFALGYSRGDPNRLIHGYDSEGNVCGSKNPQLKNGLDKTGSPYTFYGNPFDPDQARMCVPNCPTQLGVSRSGVSIVVDYSNVYCRSSYSRATASTPVPSTDIYSGVSIDTFGLGCSGNSCPCYVGYWSKSVFRRCIPNPTAGNFSASTVVTNAVNSITTKMLADINEAKIVILCCGFIALALAFVWLLLLRLCAGCMVWTSILLVVAVFALVTAFLWYETYLAHAAYSGGSTEIQASRIRSVGANYTTLLILAIIFSFFLLIILLVLLFLIKRIRIAVEVIKEAARAVAAIPALLILPCVLFIIFGGFFAFWISAWMYLASAGSPVYDSAGKFVEYQDSNEIRGLQVYHVFGFLWTLAFFMAFNEIAIAGAVASWYFRGPDGKLMPRFPLLASVGRVFRYHIGSIALGSFIIAVIQFIRLVIKYLAYQAKKQHNKCLTFCLNCLGYCIRCCESIVKFLNRNAYVIIAIEGTNFCTSAKNALGYILSNAARLFALNFVGAFLLFLGKLFVTSIVGIIALEWLRKTDNLSYWAICWILIVVMAYCISAGFMSVFEMAIDTIFLSFLVDESKHNGQFADDKLQKLSDAQAAQKKLDDGKKDDKTKK